MGEGSGVRLPDRQRTRDLWSGAVGRRLPGLLFLLGVLWSLGMIGKAALG